MGRSAKRAFDVLGIVVSLGKIGGRLVEGPLAALIAGLGMRGGRNSSSESGGRSYRPAPETYSMLTSHPLVPAFIVLVVLLLVGTSAPVRVWLTKSEHLPNLLEIFALRSREQSTALPKAREDVSVWTKKQSGFYYCQGGTLFGSKPGEMMTQAKALTVGYRPAGGQYCTDGPAQEVFDNALPARVRRRIEAVGNRVSNLDLSLKLALKKNSAVPKADEAVSVWAKKQSGFYYCKGGVLFGNKPGQMMKQSEALAAGYQPAGSQYCTNYKPNEASVGNLSFRASTATK